LNFYPPGKRLAAYDGGVGINMKTNILLLALTLLSMSQAEAQRLPASETVNNDNSIQKITEFINSGAYMTNKPIPLSEEAQRDSSHLYYTHVSPERMEEYKRLLNNPTGPDTASTEAKPAAKATDSSK
jgi:hypothetical protein